jgi:hypothetical protein
MSSPSPADRRSWEQLWHGTVWERLVAGRWLPLVPEGDRQVVVSAWNPGSRVLPAAVNRARDTLLESELRAMGLEPGRARGRSADGGWCEEGWLIPHRPARTRALLRRYGQVAGWSGRLCWADDG